MVNILRFTVAYLNATIIVKPETQNRRLEPTGLAKPRETRGLTGTGLGLARQESAGQGFWRFWNWIDMILRSKPGPLPGHPDPLLTLNVGHDYGTYSWGRDTRFNPTSNGLSAACGEWMKCQTLMCASQSTRYCTAQQSDRLCNVFRNLSIIIRSIGFVQWWWGIPIGWQCGWDNTRTKRSRSTLIDLRQALFEFATMSTQEQGTNQFKSQSLSLRPNWD